MFVKELFDIDEQLAYFYKIHERYPSLLDLRHHRITRKMQSKINIINQKLYLITKVNDFEVDGNADEPAFENRFKLDFALQCVDEENQVVFT